MIEYAAMKKVDIPIARANRLINNGCVILVTSKYKDKSNIVTIAWHTPVSHKPKYVAICVHKKHFSQILIRKSQQFAINIPDRNLVRSVHICGSISGRKVDKFKAAGLTAVAADLIDVPIIEECIAHIECRVKRAYPAGDHTIFLGEVLKAKAQAEVFNGDFLRLDDPRFKTLHHLGGDLYMVSGNVIKGS